MADPLGFRYRIISSVLCLSLAFPSPIFSKDPPAKSCPRELLIQTTAKTIVEQRLGKMSSSFQKNIQKQIKERIQADCPNLQDCSLEELNHVVLSAAHDIVDRHEVRPKWKSLFVFGITLPLYAALVIGLKWLLPELVADGLALVISFCLLVLIQSVGSTAMDDLEAVSRLWTWAFDALETAPGRGAAQRRHRAIYGRNQGRITTLEAEARNWDSATFVQLVSTQLHCTPFQGECKRDFLVRAAYAMAGFLSYNVPKYLELDLSDPDYANWVKNTFSRHFLDDTNREDFRRSVMTIVEELDLNAEREGRLEKYNRIVRAWTESAPPIYLPLQQVPPPSPPTSP